VPEPDSRLARAGHRSAEDLEAAFQCFPRRALEAFFDTERPCDGVGAGPRGEELLRSLTEFYASGLSLAAAARHLYVHRHTLEYRLNRIEALLGADPKSQPTRLFLELALALRD